MLSVVIGLLVFGEIIPGFEAYTDWKKTELRPNLTYHDPLQKTLERRPALDSFTNQSIKPLENYILKDNDTRTGRKYDYYNRNFQSGRSAQNRKTDITRMVFRASKLFRPRYKSLKTTCDRNVYKVYSNNEKSNMFRNNYELWNINNYSPDSINHKIRRSEPADEFSDDTHFILDDDYSLLNYVDNWKGVKKVDEDEDDRRESMKRMLKKKKLKRESDDKEFSVMFHSKKDHEYRDSLSNSYDFYKNAKKKPSLHSEKKKYRHEYGKPERKLSFMERRNNLKESYDHVARTSLNMKSSKRKNPFWTSRKDKTGAKLDALRNAIMSNSKGLSMTSLVPPRNVLHWATTRSYVAAISEQNRITPAVMTQKAPLVPPVLVPFLNLTDSIMSAKKSDVVSAAPSQVPLEQAAVEVNQNGNPKYLRLGNSHIDIRNLKSNLQFPFAFNVPISKQDKNQPVYGPPVQVTTPVIFIFNAPTDVINPLSNHLDSFKNTTTWNTKQGPPGNLMSSLVNLVNYQMEASSNRDSNTSQAEQTVQLPRQVDKPRKSMDVDLQGLTLNTPTRRTQYVQDINFDPVTFDPRAGPNVTPGPLIGAEALVHFLQNALLPQNSVFNKIQSEVPKTMVRTTAEPNIIRDLPINNNLIQILAPTKAVFTEMAPLLPLFTTEEPLMSRFSDIINQNADRKIPIVYDIEDAPQLISKPTKLNMTVFGHELHEMPYNRFERGIIESKTNSTKKKKTNRKMTVKHKEVEKQVNLTTAWLSHILTTTENMLYSEIKIQNQLEANKPKSKKLNLLFKSKSKPNITSVTDKPISKPKGKTNLTSTAPNGRERKSITERMTSVTKSVTTEESGLEAKRRCCCCCTSCCCDPEQQCSKTTRQGCRRGTTCAYSLTFDNYDARHHTPPLELTTPISCEPYNISTGSISCPNCHHEFTYKLGFKNLIV